MTILIQDLDQVEAWESQNAPTMPIGRHPSEVVSVEEKPAATGSPQIIIQWRSIAGPAIGTELREWLVILPQTYGKVKAFLQALNWQLKPGEFAMPTTELVGRRATVVVGNEERNGKTFSRVIGHMPVTVESDVPIDTSGLGGAPASDGTALPF